jgi:hypothetical protein
MRLAALLLLYAAGASSEEVEAPTQWGTRGHLSARAAPGGGPGQFQVQLADYWGTYSVTSSASVTGPGAQAAVGEPQGRAERRVRKS